MDSREAGRIQAQAQKACEDQKSNRDNYITGGMRPMTYVEVLEHKRDRMIEDLHAIGELISIAKNSNLSDHTMSLIQRFS